MFVATGCGKSTIREYESQACSTNDSDDPLLVCSPAYDLVCINTYSVIVQNPKEAVKWEGGVRPVYVCRITCASDSECLQSQDVCCPGVIHGKTYGGKTKGCVPQGMCQALRGTGDDAAVSDGPVDGGAPDEAAPADSRGEAGGGDAGAPDAASDASDAASDASNL
jgi:hypothetical protein